MVVNRDIYNEVCKSGIGGQSVSIICSKFGFTLEDATKFDKCLKQKWIKADHSKKVFEKKFSGWLDTDIIYAQKLPRPAAGGNKEVYFSFSIFFQYLI